MSAGLAGRGRGAPVDGAVAAVRCGVRAADEFAAAVALVTSACERGVLKV